MWYELLRPPNGSETAALSEIDNIMQILPKERVLLLVFGYYDLNMKGKHLSLLCIKII